MLGAAEDGQVQAYIVAQMNDAENIAKKRLLFTAQESKKVCGSC